MKQLALARLAFLIGASDIAASVHNFHKGDIGMCIFASLAAFLCYVIGFSLVKGRDE